ncbi:MAG: 1-(5-phosphoribosyl)-5-amino-4-imidazole-carboxylate carboxylase [Candidatus Wallbacteria bacterium HGW-Wallbacteria-1]|uniref:1-(5-phosphoribosyl)-5-amino-4-imidazole-carboxylate carboxylase n=1 Tax=Candidatus Wallbacteria bacterium HGW-Wallbacteria-1 TaxID=2013854 RepID=A0A2N1PMP8_9BACT|nr:MAG: 1-(5-phosphoribosyl)-5-amino-4-imidazole-carboxylate carboxylase [Candidatus Wallbacteria bacterium HGW-Wallbacteria-1]
MNPEALKTLLNAVADGQVTPDSALQRLRKLPFEDIGVARIDHHRELRNGFPEVVFGQFKTPEDIVRIVETLHRKGGRVIVTRVGPEICSMLANLPATYHERARMVLVGTPPSPEERIGKVAIVTGGTADIPVAEEAALTMEMMGTNVVRIFDVGVAGIHRLIACLPELADVNIIIAVAGMEGALPSVVAGLTGCPVIAVPTSVGYGASFGGVAALLGMLNSCASGVTVVNIDNGFGAGYAAHLMNSRINAGPAEEKDENRLC